MPYLVSILPRAERDLQSIFLFIQAQTSEPASKWFNGLVDTIQTLAHHPQRCAAIAEKPRLRHLLYGAKPHVYRIIYAIDVQNLQVNIVHVRHGARNFKAR